MDTVQATFPGINAPIAASFTLSRGVLPSVCTFICLPQDNFDPGPGTLTFSQGGTVIQFPGCTVDAANLRKWRDGDRWRWSVQILDRRWAWAGKTIGGTYNVRLSNGRVQESSRRDAQSLAFTLLIRLGEFDSDVSRVPTNVYPPANWDGADARDELEKLCKYVNCEVVLGTDNRISIWPRGVGLDAPENNLRRHTRFRFRPRRVPGFVTVVCGPDIYQSKLLLEAIAKDGAAHKRFDETSYTGELTMADELPWSFPGITDDADRADAFETMYKWFRIYRQAEGGLGPPNCPFAITEIGELLPLRTTLLESFEDIDGDDRDQLAILEGEFWAYSDSPENQEEKRYTGRWSLIKEWGVVQTEKPVFKLDTTNYQPEEPTLYLTTSYRVKDPLQGFARLELGASTAGGSGTLVLERPELFQTFRSVYEGTNRTNVISNVDAVFPEAEAYLSMFTSEFSDPWSYEMEYSGIQPISPDGKIAQVKWQTWSTVSRPTLTLVSVNEEFDVLTPPTKHREVLNATV